MSAADPSRLVPPGTLPVSERTNWQLIRWMTGLALQHPKKCLGLLVLNIALLVLTLSGLSLIGMAFDVIRHEVDRTAPKPEGIFGLSPPEHWPWTVLVLGFGIVAVAMVRSGLRYITVLKQAVLVQAVQTRLRAGVYDKIQRLSFRFFDSNETGSIINRATSEVAAIAMFAEFAMIEVLVLVVTLVANLVYMWHIHPVLTLTSLATTPVLVFVSATYAKKLRPAYDQNRKLYDNLLRTLSENLQGQHVVKGFGLGDHENEKFHAANDAYRHQQRWIFRQTSIYSAVIGFLTQVNLIIVLAFGGYLVIKGQMLIGTGLIVFNSLLQDFSNRVVEMANMTTTLQSSLTAAQRVVEVLDAPLDIKSPPDAVKMPKPKGRVAFEEVTFGYKQEEPVLRGVSLVVEPGECVAILGATGSGKSTLLSLVPRFYDPQSGRVTLDGVDLKKIQLDDVRRSVGIVFQENFLFSNTVAANISFGWPAAPRERVEKAAKIAAAHEFIMQLENGYDTVIGEYGSNLSGGQRQRLAIARALLLEPSILVLDDATAAIDPDTENEILEAMDNAIQGRTTFVVAHRLSTLRRANRIVVMDRGRIVQVGTHDELMHAKGHYREVAELQVGDRESKSIIQARRWYDGTADSLVPWGEVL